MLESESYSSQIGEKIGRYTEYKPRVEDETGLVSCLAGLRIAAAPQSGELVSR